MAFAGDISYFLDKYGDMVFRLAVSYMKNRQDAEDVVQDVFMILLKKEIIFENNEHQKAWLLRTTINICKNKLKLFWRRNVFSIDEFSEFSYDENYNENFVLEAVMNLPTQHRVVVYLYYYEGYKTAEISKILGKEESTVRSILHRARNKLKKILKEEYDFE